MDEQKLFVEWSDRLSVDVPFIDEQHKKLLQITNDLYQGCLQDEEVASAFFRHAIRGAVEYVQTHFADEEKLLAQAQYPGLEAQKKQHADFVLEVLQQVSEFESGKKFVPLSFVRFLRDWILSHIAMEDKKYAEYLATLKK